MKPTRLLSCLLVFCVTVPQLGCQCWQPAHAQDKGCVVLHEVIDCTKDASVSLGPALAALVDSIIAGGTANINWADLEARLESAGLKDGGCFLAQLEQDLIGKLGAFKSGTVVHDALTQSKQSVANIFTRFKDKRGVANVKFIVFGADGKPVTQ